MAILLLVVFVSSTAAFGKQASGSKSDWAAVQSVAVDEKVRVKLKDGKSLEGKLRGVSDAALTVDQKGKTLDLSKDSIAKVYRFAKQPGRAIGKSTAIGAGIGFGIGAGVGIAGGTYEDLETGGLVALLGGIGAAIGAGIGAVVGAFGSKERRVLIYEVK
jgi:hypothetical protein